MLRSLFTSSSCALSAIALSLTSAALLTQPVLAQGDVCSTATSIAGEGTFAFDNSIAPTSGFNGGGPCANFIRNDQFFQWTASAAGSYRFDTLGTVFDTHIAVHEGAGCAAVCVGSNDNAPGGLHSEIDVTGVQAGDTFLLQVGSFHLSSGSGQLNITQVGSPCSSSSDDSFEPNDVCAARKPITAGLHTNLWIYATDPDYYEITLQPGQILTVDVASDFPGDVDLVLFDQSCDWIDEDGQTLTVQNLESFPTTYTLNAWLDTNSNPNLCAEYSLDISVENDPCTGYVEDSLEDNDACNQSITLFNGTMPNLAVSRWDKDIFTVCIPPQSTVTVDLLFDHSQGDIDCFLLPTWSFPCAIGNAGFFFTSSRTVTDNEQVSWSNVSNESLTVFIEIEIFEGSSSNCNQYDLIVQGAGDCHIGNIFCSPAVPNSTGSYGRIGAFGSLLAADQTLELSARFLPEGQFGYFLGGLQQGFLPNPAGSQGNLCLDVNLGIVRFNLPGQIGQVVASEMKIPIDIGNIPFPPNQIISVSAGETWYFQGWHRDQLNGQPSSNFTTGVAITYQ